MIEWRGNEEEEFVWFPRDCSTGVGTLCRGEMGREGIRHTIQLCKS